jgi:hypothetical protein
MVEFEREGSGDMVNNGHFECPDLNGEVPHGISVYFGGGDGAQCRYCGKMRLTMWVMVIQVLRTGGMARIPHRLAEYLPPQ